MTLLRTIFFPRVVPEEAKAQRTSESTQRKLDSKAALSRALRKYDNAVEVSDETGLLVPTYLGISTIPEAGIGRFLDVDVKKGDIIRVQKAGCPNLECFDSVESMEARLLEEGIEFVRDFGHVGPQDVPETAGLLFMNDPPLYSNHSTGADRNMETIWEGDTKFIRMIRDAKAGEELKEDYRKFGELPWYEEYMVRNSQLPVRLLGEIIG